MMMKQEQNQGGVAGGIAYHITGLLYVLDWIVWFICGVTK